MLREPPRYETLVIQVSLALLLCIGVIAVFASVLVTQHGRPVDALLRLAIPATVVVSCLAAFAFVRRGRARTGVTLVLAASYLSILVYVVAGGYGLHSYLFGIFALIIMAASLLVGRVAGVITTLMALVTVLVLFALERKGYMTDQEAVRSIPLPNIATVYCILFMSVGAVQYVYSRVFQDMLQAAGEQEMRFRQVMEAAPLGQIVHRDGRVLMINSVAARLVDAAPDALTGVGVKTFIEPAQHAHFEERMAAARQSARGHSVGAEYQIRGSGGHVRLFETLTSPVDFIDGPALLTVLRDVTEERATSAALAAAKIEAESANRAKSQFLANMSHEIRTPMNAILGLSEMLAGPRGSGHDLGRSGLSSPGMSGPPLTGTQLHYARTIHQSAGTLLALINDVLDVSRIEEGYFALEQQPFALAALVDGVRDTLLPLAESKQLRLDIGIDAALPPVLSGDPSRLRQIVLNLAGNAIKFTAKGRVAMEVRAAVQTASGAQPVAAEQAPTAAAATSHPQAALRLLIRVTDSGAGIAPEHLAHLFERFVQADASDTRRHGGSGLGLYIVRELAQRMGGGVSVQSVPGLGSCFEVTVALALPSPAALAAWQAGVAAQASPLVLPPLPAPQAGAADSAALLAHAAAVTVSVTEPVADPPAAALTVLLVEDNEINRMVARGMLTTAGHEVIEAADGVQALACHAAQTFDCILMDVQMPVMSGIEATRQIRAREAGSGSQPAPIIALTANAMQGDRERCLAAGMSDFLAKPYERADLLAALARITPAKPNPVITPPLI